MERIRVLIVDDSFVVRRIVSDELAAHAELEVVGTAVNGQEAITKAGDLRPDLIILDVEMPVMDGLTALTFLQQRFPRILVIMFSSRTELGAAATLEALSRGASDFFTKPSGAGSPEASREIIRKELIPSIRALFAKRAHTTVAAPLKTPQAQAPPTPPPKSLPSRVDVLAIGASTGGPNALADLFAGLPANFPVPIVVVQHMPPMFTQMLAERLSKSSRIPTVEAKSGMTLEPGKAWIAPGDYHMVITREGTAVRTKVNQESPENACRPAVDPLLRSVTTVYGAASLVVILTGMGQDGLRGCEGVRAAGGQILAQDEATSVVWGMPGHVARAGLADQVLPLSLLNGEIMRRVRIGRD